MQSTHSPSAVEPTTPPNRTAGPTTSGGPRRPIRLSPDAQVISPLGSSPSRPSLSPSHAWRIRRHVLDPVQHSPAEQDLRSLFAAVREDDSESVSSSLKASSGLPVKDPDTGETLVFAAAVSGAWRVVALLADDFTHAIVDEPVNGQRAMDVAVRHSQDFDPVLMSRWQRLLHHIQNYEARPSMRIQSGLMSLALGPAARSSGGSGERPLLEPKEHLMAQLGQLLERLEGLLGTEHDKGTNAEVFAEVDLGDSATRAEFKAVMKREQNVLQTLKPALQRWGDFIRQLIDIGRRPLPDPHANSRSIHDQGTLDEDANAEPLIESLERLGSRLNLPAMDALAIKETTAALNSLMDEMTGRETVRMTMQQVLLAQRYFEELPGALLQDKRSLIRTVESVLRVADEAHGGRKGLLQEIDRVVEKCDTLQREADDLRHRANDIRPKDDDSRPEARTLRQRANDLLKQAEAKRRQALHHEFGKTAGQLSQVDEWIQEAAAIRPADEESGPHAAALRERADELVQRAEAMSERVDLNAVTSYRTLRLYVALDQRDPHDLELHPGHLMAACLRLARKYTGRRDNVDGSDRSMELSGDNDMVAKILHAERCILGALDYRLAKHMVGVDEGGKRLPDTRLYRVEVGGKPRSPSSPGRHLLSGSSPRQVLGRLLSSDR